MLRRKKDQERRYNNIENYESLLQHHPTPKKIRALPLRLILRPVENSQSGESLIVPETIEEGTNLEWPTIRLELVRFRLAEAWKDMRGCPA